MAASCPRVLSWYTGPGAVRQIASAFRRAGFAVSTGTEKVYVSVPRRMAEHKRCDRLRISDAMLETLKRSAGTKFGLRAHEGGASYNVDITDLPGRHRRRHG